VSRLTVPVRSRLKDDADPAALDRVWKGIQRRRAERVRRGPWMTYAPALAAAAAVVLLVVAWRGGVLGGARDGGGPLHLAGGADVVALVGAGAAPTTFDFTDGSEVIVEPGARVETLDNGPTAFATKLASGAATFEVRPGGPRRWSVECGLMTVEVVGTRFRVERGAASARVVVERGTVLVRGERVRDRVQRVTAGESLEVTDTTASAEPPPAPAASAAASTSTSSASTSTSATAQAQGVAPAPPSVAPPPPGAVPSVARVAPSAAGAAAGDPPSGAGAPSPAPSASAWRNLAREGDHADAYAALGSAGIASEAQVASVDDLLVLADVARLSGHPADAVAPLTRVVNEHAGDSRAPLAAFTLGRIQLDSLGRPAAAADAFARAIALGLPQSLREDAYARLVEARARAGDKAGAAAAAREYEQRFPAGQRLEHVRRWARGG